MAFSLPNLLNEFQEYLAQHGKSNHTLRGYLDDVRAVLQKAGAIQPQNFIELAASLNKGIERLKEEGIRNTYNRRVAGVNAFNHFLESIHSIVEAKHYSRSEGKETIRIITEEEYKHLIECIPAEELAGIRARAILSLVYNAGLTSGEITRTRYNDFKRVEGAIQSITVINKPQNKLRERVLELEKDVQMELVNYEEKILYKEVNFKFDVYPYFRTKEGEGLTNKSINVSILKWRREADLNPAIKLSSLRFAHAKKLIEHGADPKELAYKLGTTEFRANNLKNKLCE